MSSVHSPKRGFTLIELLVVIAIIALLAAILFPVFARARENARKTSCMNALKQITLAAYQYAQDYDEYWIPMRDNSNLLNPSDSTSGKPFYWAELVQPYIKSKQTQKCPSAPSPLISFTYHGRLGNFGGGRHFSEVPLPAQTIAFADCIGVPNTWSGDGGNRSPFFFQQTGNIYGRFVNGAPFKYNNAREALVDADRHLEGANYSFADGHAKWLKPRAVPAGWFTAFTPKPEDLLQPPSLGLDYDCDGVLGDEVNYD